MNGKNKKIGLKDLGYSAYFESAWKASGVDVFSVSRVISEYRGGYRIKNTTNEYSAKITGKQMFDAEYKEDYPAVGDWVSITESDAKHAIIHKVLPRKTILKRKAANKFDTQIIASNIDAAFIMQSVDRDFNLNRFDRYLTIVNEGNIKPVIVLNKIDLISEPELNLKISQVRSRFNDIDVFPTSAIADRGIRELTAFIKRGKTYCFLGSSGVGKSSIINNLLGKKILKTGSLSSLTGKGKHITARREMLFLKNGGIVIDTPGMRELGLADSNTGIENVFNEISELLKNCKFANCTHTHEPGCAIHAAIKSGKLDEKKYASYIKLKKEAGYYQMTMLDKRRNDRKFGKFIKDAKAHQKKYELLKEGGDDN
ncbi:MAG: ribosome small subunit-dependent GTPase A [bacterium]